jgi:hypothetical protein
MKRNFIQTRFAIGDKIFSPYDLNGMIAGQVYTITGMTITIDGAKQTEFYALDNRLGLPEDSLAYNQVRLVKD